MRRLLAVLSACCLSAQPAAAGPVLSGARAQAGPAVPGVAPIPALASGAGLYSSAALPALGALASSEGFGTAAAALGGEGRAPLAGEGGVHAPLTLEAAIGLLPAAPAAASDAATPAPGMLAYDAQAPPRAEGGASEPAGARAADGEDPLASRIWGQALAMGLAGRQRAGDVGGEEAPFPADESVRGKTMLMVGTKSSRPFILKEAVRTAAALGINLVVLDDPKSRPHSAGAVADADFIPAAVDDREEGNIQRIVDQVVALARTRKIDVVTSFLSKHARLTARITDAIRAAGIPGSAVAAADEKAATREVLNTVPGLEVPFRRVDSEKEARRAFRELDGAKFVMKGVRGENSRFVYVGIESEDEAAKAYRKLDGEIRAFMARPESKTTTFSTHPGIFIEGFLKKAKGTGEVSVELVMQRGKPALAMVSDTQGIGPDRELLGGSLTFPSQQGAALSAAVTEAAAKAAAALGITDGNARVDLIMTKQGPKVIEVNPFLGGAAIWKCIELLTGISFIEQGMRALLGLKVAPGRAPEGVVDYRFMAAKHTGHIERIKGLDAARGSPGVRQLRMFVKVGGDVIAAEDDSYEEIGEVISWGRTIREAWARSLAALRHIRIWIQRRSSKVRDQYGDYLQPKKP